MATERPRDPVTLDIHQILSVLPHRFPFVMVDRVTEIITQLRERGFQSPYLRAYVVARLNPLRFQRGATTADLPEILKKMRDSAAKFDTAKVRPQDLARAGGPPEAAEE